jgi:aspartate aminotransferase
MSKKTYLSKRAKEVGASVTLKISAKAKKLKKNGVDVIGFGAGEPDFNTPENIGQAGKDAIKDGFTRYTPASGINELKQAVVEKLKRDNGLSYEQSQVIIGCGAKHILYNFCQVVCDPGDEIIFFDPFWVSYPEMVKLAGGVPVVVETTEENDFVPSIEKLREKITDRTKAIIINTPNNPTGAVYPEEILREIAAIAVENDILIVADEVYEYMVYGKNEHFSIASISEDVKNLTIVVNGVSKSYAMPGWRIGYAAGPQEIIKAMGKLQSHSTSNPCSIAQMAALEAISGDQTESRDMMKSFARRRDHIVQLCNAIDGLSALSPRGTFYLFINISEVLKRRSDIPDSMTFAKMLLDQVHVALVPGGAFGADDYVRVTFANSMDEITEGFKRIEKFLS